MYLANVLAGLLIISVLAVSLQPFVVETQAAWAVEQAGQQLARDIEATRQQAAAQNKTFFIYFDRVNHCYIIREADMFSPQLRRVNLPPDVGWAFTASPLILYPQGGNVGMSVTLSHCNTAATKKITIAPGTGRIRTSRGED